MNSFLNINFYGEFCNECIEYLTKENITFSEDVKEEIETLNLYIMKDEAEFELLNHAEYDMIFLCSKEDIKNQSLLSKNNLFWFSNINDLFLFIKYLLFITNEEGTVEIELSDLNIMLSTENKGNRAIKCENILTLGNNTVNADGRNCIFCFNLNQEWVILSAVGQIVMEITKGQSEAIMGIYEFGENENSVVFY